MHSQNNAWKAKVWLPPTSITRSDMKHPQRNTENFEFNLGQAPNLRCLQTPGTTVCTQCQNCLVREIVLKTRQWFVRAGEQTKRKLIHGLIRRANSAQLLRYVSGILGAVRGKDYGYARSRLTPSLEGDRVGAGSDRALTATETRDRMARLYRWYADVPYWSKANFLMAVLQMCDGQLLHSTATLVRTTLANHNRGISAGTGHEDDHEDHERESLADTVCSYDSHNYPENGWLRSTAVDYAAPIEPFTEILGGALDAAQGDGTRDGDVPHISVDVARDEESVSDQSSAAPDTLVLPVFRRSLAGVMKYRDFIRDLPVHLSKFILSFLEFADLVSCQHVSQHWQAIAGEVAEDMRFRQAVWEEVMLMQGSSSKGGNPVYASYLHIDVPQTVPGSFEAFISEAEPVNVNFKNEIDMETSYSGLATSPVSMEARNVYCGPYNIMVLSEEEDYNRTVHYNVGNLVAVGSFDRHVHFVDINSGREVGPVIRGHAGSIKSLYLNTEEGCVLTGSFDTSIRCWHIKTGKPKKIFNGHQGTIRCLDMFGNRLVSGSKDNSVKVWNFDSGKCIRTFEHAKRINCVAVYEDTVVSGCEGGRVKVWSIDRACLIKMLHKSPKDKNQFGLSDPHTHTGSITCVKVDRYHIASGSTDGYALIWSAVGNVNKCIRALRHPKEVLCLSMTYLRLVTGCEDGKLRIWNQLTGDCLRVMRGNSRSDPVLDMYPCGNRLVINTTNNLLILNFEEITWDYDQDEKVELLRHKYDFGEGALRQHSYTYVRAQRSERAASANPKLVSDRRGFQTSSDVTVRMKQRPLSHSGRSLSPQKMRRAEQIQRCYQDVRLTASARGSVYHNLTDAQSRPRVDPGHHGPRGSSPHSGVNKRSPSPSRANSRCSLPPKSCISSTSDRRGFCLSSARSGEYVAYSQSGQLDEQADQSRNDRNSLRSFSRLSNTGCLSQSRPSTAKSSSSLRTTRSRLHMPQRGSSAPVRPVIAAKKSSSIDLSEARSLQNAEIRIEGIPVTRDKLLLSVGLTEGSKQQDSIVTINTSVNKSPIGGSTPQPSLPSGSSSEDDDIRREVMVEKGYVLSEMIVTPISKMSLDSHSRRSIHPAESSSTIPKSCLSRPQTALSRVQSRSQVQVQSRRRCKSAAGNRPGRSDICSFSSPIPRKKSHGWTTSCTETMLKPPMLMHGPSNVEKSNDDKGSTDKTKISIPAANPAVKSPFNSHGQFHLRSRRQLEAYLAGIDRKQELDAKKSLNEDRKEQRAAWRAKAVGKAHRISVPRPMAPEIGE